MGSKAKAVKGPITKERAAVPNIRLRCEREKKAAVANESAEMIPDEPI